MAVGSSLLEHLIGAIFPIALLLVLGPLLTKILSLPTEFWKHLDRFTYFISFPFLLILDLSRADFVLKEINGYVWVAAIATTVMGALILLIGRWLDVTGSVLSSIFQGGTRFNSYIFLALANALYGAPGVTYATILIATMIILTNVSSIVVLNALGEAAHKSILGTLKSTIQNPLIIAAVLGLLINRMDLKIPESMTTVIGLIASTALPMSLMSVGVGLEFAALHRCKLAVLIACSIKLVGMPALTLLLIRMLDIQGMPALIALVFACLPCAGNAYILAKQMGGNAPLMANIISISTIACLLATVVWFEMVNLLRIALR